MPFGIQKVIQLLSARLRQPLNETDAGPLWAGGQAMALAETVEEVYLEVHAIIEFSCEGAWQRLNYAVPPVPALNPD